MFFVFFRSILMSFRNFVQECGGWISVNCFFYFGPVFETTFTGRTNCVILPIFMNLLLILVKFLSL